MKTDIQSRNEFLDGEWVLLSEADSHTRWVHSEEFKVFMFRLYGSFPMMRISQYVFDQHVPNPKLRKYLLDAGYIVRMGNSSLDDSSKRIVKMYALGPQAFPLISAWQTEKMTRYVLYLTVVSTGVAVLGLIVLMIQLYLIL